MVGFADAAGRTYGPFEFRASQAGAVSDFTGSVTVGEETTVLTKIYAYYYGSGVTGVNADLRAGTLAFGLPAVQNGNLSDYTSEWLTRRASIPSRRGLRSLRCRPVSLSVPLWRVLM